MDHFTLCNTDVLCLIFALCDIPTLALLAQVCRLLHGIIALDGRLVEWKTLFDRENIQEFMIAAIDANEVALVYWSMRHGAIIPRECVRGNERVSPLYHANKAHNKELTQFFIDNGDHLIHGLCGACVSSNKTYVNWYLSMDKIDLVRHAVLLMSYAGRSGDVGIVRSLLERMDETDMSSERRHMAINYGLADACMAGHRSTAETFFALGATYVGAALGTAVHNKQFAIARWLIHEKEPSGTDWHWGLTGAATIQSQEWFDYFTARIEGHEGEMPRD